MQPYSHVSALILAGGQSSRMGTDKSVLAWQGIPLLRHVHNVASFCCETVQVLTPWPERYESILPPDTRFLVEQHPNQGPLWAMSQGFSHALTDWVWVLACDLPLLEPEIVMPWLLLPLSLSTDVLAIAPLNQQNDETIGMSLARSKTQNLIPKRLHRWEPLCAIYRRSAVENLMAYLTHDRTVDSSRHKPSLQHWLDQIAVHPIPITETNKHLFYNCNKPSDFDQIPLN